MKQQLNVTENEFIISLDRSRPFEQILTGEALAAIASSLSKEGLLQAAKYFAEKGEAREGGSIIEKLMAGSEP